MREFYLRVASWKLASELHAGPESDPRLKTLHIKKEPLRVTVIQCRMNNLQCYCIIMIDVTKVQHTPPKPCAVLLCCFRAGVAAVIPLVVCSYESSFGFETMTGYHC